MADDWIRGLARTEIEILRLCSVYAAEGMSVRPSARGAAPLDALALHCTKCNWYAPIYDGGEATGPTLMLQHLMMAHIDMYERAMFHAQRKASNIPRDLWQGKSKDNMTLDLLANKHNEAGGTRIVFYCALCRQYAADDREKEQFVRQTMHEHMEVCHRAEYNEARRFAAEAVDGAERAQAKSVESQGGATRLPEDLEAAKAAAERAIGESRRLREDGSTAGIA